MSVSLSLLNKYNVPVPRYTSYPTVPFWADSIDTGRWKTAFSGAFRKSNEEIGISLYLHLPFCESLCTYCGCNKKITTNHGVEGDYIDALISEWKGYLALMETQPVIRELHLGGGTPTFFSPENLHRLLSNLLNDARIHTQHEFSIEGHPNNTTAKHLRVLYDLGFRRISYGVQDNDPEVQRVINRIQPFANVQRATEMARETGFTSVNFDLIYGLPRQTLQTMEKTILQTLGAKPDRVAFYSYAHVPWTSRGQRLFDESDLPSPALKMELYGLGKELFQAHGYHDIGMDHFALPDDELHKAWKSGTLYRNFMGYTTMHTRFLLGLGVSAISDTGTAFAQNEKALHDYYGRIADGTLPVRKGYFLEAEDQWFRKYILDTSCQGKTAFNPLHLPLLKQYSFPELEKLEADGLVHWDENGLMLTETGRHFIRNVCRAFDLHLLRSGENTSKPLFSKAV